MTRIDVIREYGLPDDATRITTPGKFEGEPLWAPYFWEAALDGSGDFDEIDGVYVSTFDIDPDDVKAFPELGQFAKVQVWENDQGFVFTSAVPK